MNASATGTLTKSGGCGCGCSGGPAISNAKTGNQQVAEAAR